jgi:hypothetical protein
MIRSFQEHSRCVGSPTCFSPLRVWRAPKSLRLHMSCSAMSLRVLRLLLRACGEPLIFKSLCRLMNSTRCLCASQASIARLRVTANLLEPASSDELHYDHVPARPPAFLTRPQAIVDRLEPDSSDELLRAFRSLPRPARRCSDHASHSTTLRSKETARDGSLKRTPWAMNMGRAWRVSSQTLMGYTLTCKR